jgi:transcriptional regulator with XRE-family HTH domain
MYNLKQTGECVKRLRMRKNLTQEKMADQMYKNVDTVRKIEQGKHGMSVDLLIEMADFFGVSTDYLLCRNNGIDDCKHVLIRLKSEIDSLLDSEINM